MKMGGGAHGSLLSEGTPGGTEGAGLGDGRVQRGSQEGHHTGSGEQIVIPMVNQ
jgi:hypothetical protein